MCCSSLWSAGGAAIRASATNRFIKLIKKSCFRNRMRAGHIWSCGGEEDTGSWITPDHHHTLERQRSSFLQKTHPQATRLYNTSPLSDRERRWTKTQIPCYLVFKSDYYYYYILITIQFACRPFLTLVFVCFFTEQARDTHIISLLPGSHLLISRVVHMWADGV